MRLVSIVSKVLIFFSVQSCGTVGGAINGAGKDVMNLIEWGIKIIWKKFNNVKTN